MLIAAIVDERLDDYYKPALFVGMPFCDFKCCKEAGLPASICQNNHILNADKINVSPQNIFEIYKNNPITTSVVIGGLEPMLSFVDVLSVIRCFREHGCHDEFVIYTGYEEGEIPKQIEALKKYDNIIVKFGRYRPNQEPHMDEVLGVKLASDNQYARKVC